MPSEVLNQTLAIRLGEHCPSCNQALSVQFTRTIPNGQLMYRVVSGWHETPWKPATGFEDKKLLAR